jgi:Flp pilus assembly protein TadG
VGRHRLADDGGSAVVEFALVTPLLLAVALGVLQIVLALHVRATLTSAAAEGARAAALAGSDPRAGVLRTRALLEEDLAGSLVRDVSARRAVVDGLPVMAVRVDARLPVAGLVGPDILTVEAHALQEGWQ